MPKNVMKLSKSSPHRARNDFDLSHRHLFMANFGELLPASCIETVPGDHIEMRASDLIRAIPLVTSPFLRAKQHIDVWFVPYRDLWHQFDSFITQKSQPVSSALKGASFLPHCDMYALMADGVMTGTSGAAPFDVTGRFKQLGSQKLVNLLGYGVDSVVGSAQATAKVNLFRLAAYNYIWYNEYRQQYYDDGTLNLASGQNVAELFNFDDLPCTSQATANLDTWSSTYQARLEAMTQMRYRCWKKDLFTGLLPSTQFGSVSTVGVTLPVSVTIQNNATAAASNNAFVSSGRNLVAADSSDTPIVSSSQWNLVQGASFSGNNFDVLALRRSEAVQIWRENALRAGNRVKDNMLAHYGVASDFEDHRPTYLGSVDAPLNIGDVMATANSTASGVPNNAVGDIAGKGLSSLEEKVFKYDAKDFGVIMVMFSMLPEAEYNARGIDRMNQLVEAEDFFIPEYENLGLEAVSSQNFEYVPPSAAKVVGYAPRYYGYKTKLDKVFGAMMSSRAYAPWTSPKFDVTAAMTTPAGSIPLNTLYVNPKIYDVNFSLALSSSDQFLVDIYFDVDAVRPMSVIGLPFS